MGPKKQVEERLFKKVKRRLPVGDLAGNFSDRSSFYTYLKE